MHLSQPYLLFLGDAPDMLTETVMEGRYNADGVFEATVLLTKCGSRYEAAPESLQRADEGTTT